MKGFSRLTRFAVAVLIVMSMLALSGASPALAGATVTVDNASIPFDLFVFVPCAADGAGELVHLQGPIHVLFQFVVDGDGGVHGTSHFQPQGIAGLGLTTGDSYHATGETVDRFNSKVGLTYTFVNNFKIIGQGPGNNFLVHENLHFTVNANGTLTVTVDNFSVECR